MKQHGIVLLPGRMEFLILAYSLLFSLTCFAQSENQNGTNSSEEEWKGWKKTYKAKGKYGFMIELNGKKQKLTEPLFEYAHSFSEWDCPFTIVGKDCQTNKNNEKTTCLKYAIIDKNFNLVSGYEFDHVDMQKRHNIVRVIKDKKVGLFDPIKKRYIIEPVAAEIPLDYYSERVNTRKTFLYKAYDTHLFGMVDRNGNEILKPVFKNWAALSLPDKTYYLLGKDVYGKTKYGVYIDANEVIPVEYDELYTTSENPNDKKNYNSPIYYSSLRFFDYIIGIKGDLKDVYWKDNMKKLPPEVYNNINDKCCGYFSVKQIGSNKLGLYSSISDKMIDNYSYDSIFIHKVSENCMFFLVFKHGKYFIIDDSNNKISNEYDKRLKPNYEFEYNQDWGLCEDNNCETVYYVDKYCKLTSVNITKEKRGPIGNVISVQDEVEKMSKSFSNSLNTQPEKCRCCFGSGKDRQTANTYKTCKKCGGDGVYTYQPNIYVSGQGNTFGNYVSEKCDECKGSGKVLDSEISLPCKCCNGSAKN